MVTIVSVEAGQLASGVYYDAHRLRAAMRSVASALIWRCLRANSLRPERIEAIDAAGRSSANRPAVSCWAHSSSTVISRCSATAARWQARASGTPMSMSMCQVPGARCQVPNVWFRWSHGGRKVTPP